MERDIFWRKEWLHIPFYLLIIFSLTGCITPRSEVAPGAKPETYRKVYLIQAKQDRRNVGPEVKARLDKTGFKVTVIKEDVDEIDSQGTGFVINFNGDVLTCAHVVGHETNVTVWIDGHRQVCRVLSADTNTDLAVLRINGDHPKFTPLLFAPGTNYSMGQDVFSMGFPLADILGLSPRLNKGLISATVGLNDDPKSIQFSAAVQPGNSGGPLLNARGEVIGVISATLNPMGVLVRSGGNLPQNVNFAIKMGSIRKFLESIQVAPVYSVSNSAANPFDDAQKSLGLIRAGIVTDEELKQPAAVCVYEYVSLWDMWFRFRAIEIRFYDAKKGGQIFKVGQYVDDPFSSESGELDNLFGAISDDFFPDQPNPFKGKKNVSSAKTAANK